MPDAPLTSALYGPTVIAGSWGAFASVQCSLQMLELSALQLSCAHVMPSPHCCKAYKPKRPQRPILHVICLASHDTLLYFLYFEAHSLALRKHVSQAACKLHPRAEAWADNKTACSANLTCNRGRNCLEQQPSKTHSEAVQRFEVPAAKLDAPLQTESFAPIYFLLATFITLPCSTGLTLAAHG